MIHIFNPEHDIALGAHVEQFTAPHAARQLRHDLGFLPMIWAEEGDKVIVELGSHLLIDLALVHGEILLTCWMCANPRRSIRGAGTRHSFIVW